MYILLKSALDVFDVFYYYYYNKYTFVLLSLTWEIVHEAGLCCDNPLRSGLTEDGDVTVRLLIESCQTTAKTLCCLVGFLIRQPVIVPENYLQQTRKKNMQSSAFLYHTKH